MSNMPNDYSCHGDEHGRRSFLKIATAGGASLLSPLASVLAREHNDGPIETAKSLIVLWLEGAPSQLETFDPHPGTEIAAGSKARKTNVDGILLGDGFEQVAEQMDAISLVRAVTSKEGDHARAIYNIKTGFRPDPTLVHPSIGSVILSSDNVQRFPGLIDIPRHISILPGQWAARGWISWRPIRCLQNGRSQ